MKVKARKTGKKRMHSSSGYAPGRRSDLRAPARSPLRDSTGVSPVSAKPDEGFDAPYHDAPDPASRTRLEAQTHAEARRFGLKSPERRRAGQIGEIHAELKRGGPESREADRAPIGDLMVGRVRPFAVDESTFPINVN